MDQIASSRVAGLASDKSAQAGACLAVLGAGLGAGAIAVWALRQPWAKDEPWPWLLLLLAMFAAASALGRLDRVLPGRSILPRLAAFHSRLLVASGVAATILALALAGLVVRRLLPNIKQFQGAPLLWGLAILLAVAGAALIGPVGRGSPRAATALTLWMDTPRARRLEAIAFLAILGVAVFLRVWQLNSIPPGIYVDETNGALDALYILEGRSASPFGTGWYGTPNGYLYYMAAIFKLFGANWYALKAASLIPAILTVPAVYLLGRLMFGPLAGLSAMLLMAVSRWHLSMSRWGWNETATPLFQVLATFFLIRGLRDRRALDYSLSGLLAGLSVYTYLSARLALATLALYVIFWFLTDPSGLRASVKRSGGGILILIATALIVVAPIGVTYAKDPLAFDNRVAEISVARDIQAQGSLAPLLQNIGDALKFFHQTGDLQGKHNLPGEPMTDPITGLLFAVGVAAAILGWRDHRRFLLLAWLALGMAGSFLSSQHESPQSYRALAALPAVVLLAADVLDRVARAGVAAARERAWGPRPSRVVAWATGGLVVIALAGSGIWESTIYFGRQAASMDVVRGFNPIENQAAREVVQALQAGEAVYLSPSFSQFSPLRFLVYGVVKATTGRNTLDARPYHVLLPEVNLPVPDRGTNVLVLLDSAYWPLRGYIASFYPQARMDLVKLPDGSPVFVRVRIPHEDVAALQGLHESVSYADGRTEESDVSQVALPPSDPNISQVSWEGSIRLEHGGEYEIRGEGGLEVYLDENTVQGKQYLGRGLYQLRVVWNANGSQDAGSGRDVRLVWRGPGQAVGGFTPVPQDALFRVTGPQHGLLATYWKNANWEGEPLFQQVTPFLLLSWPDEQPVVPNGPFSARYTGFLHITEADSYLLRIEADDGARLTVDGDVVGESLDPGKPNELEGTVDLQPGDHTIQIDYFQQSGGSALRFLWSRGSEASAPVPPDVLTPGQP